MSHPVKFTCAEHLLYVLAVVFRWSPVKRWFVACSGMQALQSGSLGHAFPFDTLVDETSLNRTPAFQRRSIKSIYLQLLITELEKASLGPWRQHNLISVSKGLWDTEGARTGSKAHSNGAGFNKYASLQFLCLPAELRMRTEEPRQKRLCLTLLFSVGFFILAEISVTWETCL